MKYTVVSSVEYTYPDVWDYPTAGNTVDVFAARGGYASFQVLLGDRTSDTVKVGFDALPTGCTPELYTLVPVQVEKNHGIQPENFAPHYPERVAP